jgi:hypothetical protein
MGRALPHDLRGVDILEERIQAARDHSLPGIDLRCCNAVDLDFADASFDMISRCSGWFLMNQRECGSPPRLRGCSGRVELFCGTNFRYRPPRNGAEMMAMTRERVSGLRAASVQRFVGGSSDHAQAGSLCVGALLMAGLHYAAELALCGRPDRKTPVKERVAVEFVREMTIMHRR